MKVICIDGVKIGMIAFNTGEIANSEHCIYEGEIYNALYIDNKYGVDLYKLAERIDWLYKVTRFVPLSNFDEKEILADRYGVYAENNFK